MANYATLEVNLAAVRANYRLLKGRHTLQSSAAVVKANAYGLGVIPIAKALRDEGCKQFFVATITEAIELRGALDDAWIAVFNGIGHGEEQDYVHYNITPVLNDLGQVERFAKSMATSNLRPVFHVDTGMTRLGLSESDIKKLSSFQQAVSKAGLLMSHLACASEPAHAKNAEQLARFNTARVDFPGVKGSLVNSAGLFLPGTYHFDLARPGCALYGIAPTSLGENPVQHVATLSAPILQIRTLDKDETIGYGATYSAKKGTRIAIIGLGYADGYFRMLGNKGMAFIAGHKAAIVGRISMDMIALDISNVPISSVTTTARAEFISEKQTVNQVADLCGTIGYEIFTRIGSRVRRTHKN